MSGSTQDTRRLLRGHGDPSGDTVRLGSTVFLGAGVGGERGEAGAEDGPTWLPDWFRFGAESNRQVESDYVALVPLSDSRLRPRNTKLLVSIVSLLVLGVGLSVYLLVPRAVSVGWNGVERQTMSWNETEASYSLSLKANMHVSNPNFVHARLQGKFEVWYYSSLAGMATLKPTDIPPRGSMQVQLDIDASNVDSDYVLTILRQCTFFPHQLVVFLRAQVNATYLLKRDEWVPPIDTYAVFNCSSNDII